MIDVALWGIQALHGVENCLPKHVSHNSGIYWLKDAKEVPDMQVVSYDYGSFMLIWNCIPSMAPAKVLASTAWMQPSSSITSGGGCILRKAGLPWM
jgi:hypothetical protein